MVKKKNDLVYIRLTEEELKQKIVTHQNSIWKPELLSFHGNIKTNSWFDIHETKNKEKNTFTEKINTDVLESVNYSAKCITLHLTKTQKNIINGWLNLYAKMYNETLCYIKNHYKNEENHNVDMLNYYKLRSILFEKKHELCINSNIGINAIDYAVKEAITNYKNAYIKKKRGLIKHFRVRYWKSKKTIKTMTVIKPFFTKTGFRFKILGNVKATYNRKNYNLSTINCDSKLQCKNGKYYLYVPEKIDTKLKPMKVVNNIKDTVISLDPGIRTFMSGLGENKMIQIGSNVCSTIIKYLKRKDNIMNNVNIPALIKKKNELMINRKISNKVTDLHWKSISYLTRNFSNILIGNFSSKSAVSKEKKMNKLIKRVSLALSFYKFREKLKYKCAVKKVNYGVVHEWLTSKLCSCCGNRKEDLGTNKIYSCTTCGLDIDRDINGARNILFKAL